MILASELETFSWLSGLFCILLTAFITYINNTHAKEVKKLTQENQEYAKQIKELTVEVNDAVNHRHERGTDAPKLYDAVNEILVWKRTECEPMMKLVEALQKQVELNSNLAEDRHKFYAEKLNFLCRGETDV